MGKMQEELRNRLITALDDYLMNLYEFDIDRDSLADYLIEVIDELHSHQRKDKIIKQLQAIMDNDNVRFVDQAVRMAISIVNDEEKCLKDDEI